MPPGMGILYLGAERPYPWNCGSVFRVIIPNQHLFAFLDVVIAFFSASAIRVQICVFHRSRCLSDNFHLLLHVIGLQHALWMKLAANAFTLDSSIHLVQL